MSKNYYIKIIKITKQKLIKMRKNYYIKILKITKQKLVNKKY